jgi:hypothetical protein
MMVFLGIEKGREQEFTNASSLAADVSASIGQCVLSQTVPCAVRALC